MLISGIFHQKIIYYIYMLLEMDIKGISNISLLLIIFLGWNHSFSFAGH